MKIRIESIVNGNYQTILSRFDKTLFMALKPPLIQLDLKRFDGCEKGDRVEMELGLFGIKQSWKSLITENGVSEKEAYFIDEGAELPPPLKNWHHRHIMENLEETQTKIIDDITYSSGFFLLDLLMYPILYLQFWYRKPIYKKYFA